MQQFLGLTNFFSKFILGYCNLAAPMTELTKKKVDWCWSTDCDKAFQELSTAPVLAIPDPAAPFELSTDSCSYGIGAVLMQNSRPVAFYSRKMTDPERNYVNHEQELLAAILALKVFRCYLLGNHFTLITDNKPNTYLDSQPTLSRRQARWSEHLQRFHFSWVHKPGKFNVADPLSRNPSFRTLSVVLAVAIRRQTQSRRPAADTVTDTVTPTVDTAAETVTDTVIPTADTAANAAPAAKRRKRSDSTAEPANTEQDDVTTVTDADVDADAADTADIVSRISEAYAADPVFADGDHTKRWMFTDNLWWDHDQIVVPKDQEVKRMILREFHDSPYAGHLGTRKTVKNILRYLA